MEALPVVLLLLSLFVVVRVLRVAVDPRARQAGASSSAVVSLPQGMRTSTAP